VAQQPEQGVPVACDVQQHQRLGVQTELRPCQHLEELVQRAGAARQDQRRVGIHEHHLLALVHGLGDDQSAQIAAGHFPAHQMLRDHAQRVAAGCLRRARHLAHQTDIAGPVDQPPAGPGKRAAGLCGGHRIGRIAPRTGAAIDADRQTRGWHGLTLSMKF